MVCPTIRQHLTSNLVCSRTWLTHAEAKTLKEDTSELVNIRNLTYSQLRSTYKECRDSNPHKICYLIFRSPYFLHWAFPSILTCYMQSALNKSNEDSKPVLRLYISFEAILDKIAVPNQPISRTVSVFGEGESGNENKFIKTLTPSMTKPNTTNAAASRHQRMRDFFRVHTSYVAVARMVLELVGWHNLTLIFTNDTSNKYESEVLVKGLYPRVFANAMKSSSNNLNLNRGIYYERPMDTAAGKTDFNFMYCDIPVQMHSNIWDFSPLTISFHPIVWTLLAAVFISLAILIYVQIQLDNPFLYHFLPPFNSHTFSSVAWSLISVWVSAPTYFGLKYVLKHSPLFVAWVYATLILNNFYTGIFTSHLIQPIPHKTNDDLQDLVDNKYTAIFPEETNTVYDTIMDTITFNQEVRKKEENRNFPITDYDLMEILVTTNPRRFPEDQFFDNLAYDPKSAMIGTWLYVYSIFQKTMAYIDSKREAFMSANPGKLPNKIFCHVGKKLVPAVPMFWGFYPPNVEWLYETHLCFQQAGVDDLWKKEFYGLNFGKRVQDRSKILSETEIAQDPASLQPKPIKLDDSHFFTVITLGFVCVVISISVFIIEYIYFKVKHKVTRIFPAKREQLFQRRDLHQFKFMR